METQRLRAIQQPSAAALLLESVALASRRLPAGARPVCDESDLPSSLRHITRRLGTTGDAVWRAWTDERHTWLFTGEVSLDLSRERHRPVLRVCEYDDDAALEECALWVLARNDAWERCAA